MINIILIVRTIVVGTDHNDVVRFSALIDLNSSLGRKSVGIPLHQPLEA
jgi:hypothetical protein